MKIGLCDVDGHNFPNLPLMKLAAYHKRQGDTVEWWTALDTYDIVYKSKVFTFTPDIAYAPRAELVIEGGTGYGLKNKLPSRVEHILPDYSIYPQYPEAYGFLTRGCPRNCKFCVVSRKEGRVSARVAELREFWRGQRVIKLLDPNLLACAEHETILQKLAASGAWIDFTQGLDIRLTNPDNVALIKRLKVKMLHFAWDWPDEDLAWYFWRFKRMSGIEDYRKLSVYVLTNYNSSHEEDLFRVYTLRQLGFSPYVMIYDKASAPRETRHLQRWVNNRKIFQSVPRFEEYEAARG